MNLQLHPRAAIPNCIFCVVHRDERAALLPVDLEVEVDHLVVWVILAHEVRIVLDSRRYRVRFEDDVELLGGSLREGRDGGGAVARIAKILAEEEERVVVEAGGVGVWFRSERWGGGFENSF